MFSLPGGSMWESVPGREDLYYYHAFAKEQPDLNWYCPELRNKIYEMINWWLEKGVAGFRIDAIINIQKDTTFPDYPADGPDGLCSADTVVSRASGIGEMLEDLKKHTFALHDSFTVGEVFNGKEEELREFIGPDGHFSSIFDFSQHLLCLGKHGWYEAKPVDFKTWRSTIFASQAEVESFGRYSNIIENHDEPRGASMFLPDYGQNDAGVKMLGTVSVLLRGIPFIYQGQEIGMKNVRRTSIEEFDDISTKDQYAEALAAGLDEQEALAACNRLSRDNARTPMQWSSDKEAGFTEGTPWLAVNPDYQKTNVEAQERDPDSILHYYRKLTALRENPAYKDTFVYGCLKPVYEETEQVIAYIREYEHQRILVMGNWGQEAAELELPGTVKEVLLSNLPDVVLDGRQLWLKSCQAVVLQME